MGHWLSCRPGQPAVSTHVRYSACSLTLAYFESPPANSDTLALQTLAWTGLSRLSRLLLAVSNFKPPFRPGLHWRCSRKPCCSCARGMANLQRAMSTAWLPLRPWGSGRRAPAWVCCNMKLVSHLFTCMSSLCVQV